LLIKTSNPFTQKEVEKSKVIRPNVSLTFSVGLSIAKNIHQIKKDKRQKIKEFFICINQIFKDCAFTVLYFSKGAF